MEKLVIVGAGGLGREVKVLVEKINESSNKPLYNIEGFYDDDNDLPDNIGGLPLLGNIEQLKNRDDNLSIAISISYPEIRKKIIQNLKKDNFDFPNLIHPTVEISEGVSIGVGNILTFNCFLSCNVTLGDFNFLNTFVSVGHDTHISNLNVLMPRTQISGGVYIGNGNFFGMNSAIVQSKTIGNNNIINSYTFLTKSIKDNRKYFGIPGRKIN